MPHNMVFIGIDFLLPNRSYTNFELKYLTCIYRNFEVYFTSYLAMSVYSVSVSTECTFCNKKFRLNARKFVNDREASSVDVSKVIRSGYTLRTETLNIHSVDDKIAPVRVLF